jgi:hypothetical protein
LETARKADAQANKTSTDSVHISTSENTFSSIRTNVVGSDPLDHDLLNLYTSIFKFNVIFASDSPILQWNTSTIIGIKTDDNFLCLRFTSDDIDFSAFFGCVVHLKNSMLAMKQKGISDHEAKRYLMFVEERENPQNTNRECKTNSELSFCQRKFEKEQKNKVETNFAECVDVCGKFKDSKTDTKVDGKLVNKVKNDEKFEYKDENKCRRIQSTHNFKRDEPQANWKILAKQRDEMKNLYEEIDLKMSIDSHLNQCLKNAFILRKGVVNYEKVENLCILQRDVDESTQNIAKIVESAKKDLIENSTTKDGQ